MTAIDRSMPEPKVQRWLHALATATQQHFHAVGCVPGYTYNVINIPVQVVAKHRYSAECMTVSGGEGFTFLVPLPKENWP